VVSILILIFFLASVFTQLQAEQDEIVSKRPPTQTSLTLKEIREMEYLSKVPHPSAKIHFHLAALSQFGITFCFFFWLLFSSFDFCFW
jgi:hypothetical protein